MGIIDKCGVRGNATLCAVTFLMKLSSTESSNIMKNCHNNQGAKLIFSSL